MCLLACVRACEGTNYDPEGLVRLSSNGASGSPQAACSMSRSLRAYTRACVQMSVHMCTHTDVHIPAHKCMSMQAAIEMSVHTLYTHTVYMYMHMFVTLNLCCLLAEELSAHLDGLQLKVGHKPRLVSIIKILDGVGALFQEPVCRHVQMCVDMCVGTRVDIYAGKRQQI